MTLMTFRRRAFGLPTIALAVTCAACSPRQAERHTQPQQTTAASKDRFEGTFEYKTDGGSAEITLHRTKAKIYAVSVEVGAPGCAGAITGTATRHDDALLFVGDKTESFNETCQLEIKRKNGKLLVEEGEGCMTYHGASCSFSSYPSAK